MAAVVLSMLFLVQCFGAAARKGQEQASTQRGDWGSARMNQTKRQERGDRGIRSHSPRLAQMCEELEVGGFAS